MPLLWPREPGSLALQLQSELLEGRIHGSFNSVAPALSPVPDRWRLPIRNAPGLRTLPVLLGQTLATDLAVSQLVVLAGENDPQNVYSEVPAPSSVIFSCTELAPLSFTSLSSLPRSPALWPILKRIL